MKLLGHFIPGSVGVQFVVQFFCCVAVNLDESFYIGILWIFEYQARILSQTISPTFCTTILQCGTNSLTGR